jgi:hypothetical protein
MEKVFNLRDAASSELTFVLHMFFICSSYVLRQVVRIPRFFNRHSTIDFLINDQNLIVRLEPFILFQNSSTSSSEKEKGRYPDDEWRFLFLTVRFALPTLLNRANAFSVSAFFGSRLTTWNGNISPCCENAVSSM